MVSAKVPTARSREGGGGGGGGWDHSRTSLARGALLLSAAALVIAVTFLAPASPGTSGVFRKKENVLALEVDSAHVQQNGETFVVFHVDFSGHSDMPQLCKCFALVNERREGKEEEEEGEGEEEEEEIHQKKIFLKESNFILVDNQSEASFVAMRTQGNTSTEDSNIDVMQNQLAFLIECTAQSNGFYCLSSHSALTLMFRGENKSREEKDFTRNQDRKHGVIELHVPIIKVDAILKQELEVVMTVITYSLIASILALMRAVFKTKCTWL